MLPTDFNAILAKASDSFDLPRPLKSILLRDETWIDFAAKAYAHGIAKIEVHKNDDNPGLVLLVAGVTHERLQEETKRVLDPAAGMSLITCLISCLPEELEVLPGTWQSSNKITKNADVYFQLEVQVREKSKAD